eukprot:m.108414 g.108414  ORF g.108414 m.108414 type:complete len:290 (-) comp15913_c2_seq1:139-1008(-)
MANGASGQAGDAAGGAVLLPYRVAAAEPTVFYIPNFVDDTQAALLWRRIYEAPKPKWTTLARRRLQSWGGESKAYSTSAVAYQPRHCVSSVLQHNVCVQRRGIDACLVLAPLLTGLAVFHHASGHTDHRGLIPQPLPPWLTPLMQRIDQMGAFFGEASNHVLVNEYLPGQGIMPHEDGPLFTPAIATVTLGSHCVLQFFRKDSREQPFCSLLLEPRSLVVIQDDMYGHLHGIAEVKTDILDDLVVNRDLCDMAKQDGRDELHRSTRVSLTIRHVPKVLKGAGRLLGKLV